MGQHTCVFVQTILRAGKAGRLNHSQREQLTGDSFVNRVEAQAALGFLARNSRFSYSEEMVMTFPIHTLESAPNASQDALAAANARFGMIPNLLGILAESPAALNGYLTIAGLFEESTLSPAERQVVLLTVSIENGCEYCVAAHSTGARRQGLASGAIAALRQGATLPDARLQALRRFTQTVVRNRGWAETDAQQFLAAGFTQAQVLEVVLGVTQKTLSNYVNHLAHTPLDAAFAAERWSKPGAAQTMPPAA
jgi:uncharacterized peroxidase-related enzyme